MKAPFGKLAQVFHSLTRMHDLIDVYAEDIPVVDDLSTPPKSFQEETFWITVTDGQLNIRIQDDGGRDRNWIINSLSIKADV